jgi:hypothetical protein
MQGYESEVADLSAYGGEYFNKTGCKRRMEKRGA